MNPHPKPRRRLNEEYLHFIRSLPCAICGSMPVDAHHLKSRIFANDYSAVPACRACHIRVQNPKLDKEGEVLKQLMLWKYALELATGFLHDAHEEYLLGTGTPAGEHVVSACEGDDVPHEDGEGLSKKHPRTDGDL